MADNDVLGTVEWISIGFLLFLCVLGMARGQPAKVWRGEEEGMNPDRPSSFWPFGLALWRGWVRLGPASALIVLLACATAVALDAEVRWLSLPLSIAFLAAIALFLSIVLFARPKWAIAPSLRSQPGALVEWWNALQGRRT